MPEASGCNRMMHLPSVTTVREPPIEHAVALAGPLTTASWASAPAPTRVWEPGLAGARAGNAAEAGNKMGTTSALKRTRPLCTAHSCSGFTCGNTDLAWWRG